MAGEKVLLEVKNLKKYFDTPRGCLHAVDDVPLSFQPGKRWGSWENPAAENLLLGERSSG